MNVIKIKKRITSSTLKIKELNSFIGQEVEIIIKQEKTPHNRKKEPTIASGKASGILQKYKNANLLDKEKDAWIQAIKEKHGNS